MLLLQASVLAAFCEAETSDLAALLLVLSSFVSLHERIMVAFKQAVRIGLWLRQCAAEFPDYSMQAEVV